MSTFYVPLKKLKRNPRNRPLNLEIVKALVEEYDHKKLTPIDVLPENDYYIVKNGQHRVEMAKKLGWLTISCQLYVKKNVRQYHKAIFPVDIMKAREKGILYKKEV